MGVHQHGWPETLLQQELLHQRVDVDPAVGVREGLEDLEGTGHPSDRPELVVGADRDGHLVVVPVQQLLYGVAGVLDGVVAGDPATQPEDHHRSRATRLLRVEVDQQGRPRTVSSPTSAARRSTPVPRWVTIEEPDQVVDLFWPPSVR